MSFALFYSSPDAEVIGQSYGAARTNLSNNDRQNVDAIWNAGLSTWNTSAIHVYNAQTQTYHSACGTPTDTGLCDEDTRLIVIAGFWSRSVAAYGAVQGQTITKGGMVGLWHRVADADPDIDRRTYMHTIAEDIAATAREPYP